MLNKKRLLATAAVTLLVAGMLIIHYESHAMGGTLTATAALWMLNLLTEDM